MAETLFAEMKRYVRWADADAAALRTLGPVAAPHFERIAAEFYDRIREHEDAHAVFTGEEQIERLKRTLVRWMGRLCAGPHDEDYFLERARIGRMHVKIGLPQRYMFTAMALIRDSFQAIAGDLPPEVAAPARSALARIIDVELAIMLETYHEDWMARVRHVDQLDRERLERELARSEDRYSRAVELAPTLIIGVDAAGAIVLFNREAERVSGYARDEVLGRTFFDLMVPERERAERRRLHADLLSGAAEPSASVESALLTRAGRERTVRWHVGYAPAAAANDLTVLSIGTDVTEERVLVERTRQSERLAAVGTLAAGLAHEIRNPLNGALLHVTFLERALTRAGGNPDALDAARIIGAEIRRLSVLVKEFLVFARPAAADFRLESLRAVCQRAIEVLREDAAQAKADLVTDHPTNVFDVRIDAGKIEQVVLNLVKNAIDAVASVGGGKVTVRTRRSPRHGLLEVEDNGPGLPSPDAPIFDAFFSTKQHGTGLGLAIAHRVVSDHSGTIEVESRPGRTVFRVSLPLAAEGETSA